VGNLLSALERCLNHPAARRQTFLLGDRESTSTPELMRKLAQYTRKPARLFPFPVWGLRGLGKLGDLVHLLTRRSIGLDTYSVERLLGSLEVDPLPTFEQLQWETPFTLDEGLRLTMTRRS
jgi:nucleoside-diphosphate-sugar epimerase